MIWLFDLEADPYEHNDVSADNAGVVKTMLDRLAEIDATIVQMGVGDPRCAARTPQPWPSGNTDPESNVTQWAPWC